MTLPIKKTSVIPASFRPGSISFSGRSKWAPAKNRTGVTGLFSTLHLSWHLFQPLDSSPDTPLYPIFAFLNSEL